MHGDATRTTYVVGYVNLGGTQTGDRSGERKVALDEASASCGGGRLAAILDTELGDDVGHVAFDRTRADEEVLRDLGIGQALAKKLENFMFALSEGHRTGGFG
jgi:hypothetical protein